MKLPPISRSFRVVRNGQPSVWITWSSGFATRHTSFTPRLHACGNSPLSPNRSIAARARCPCVPSDNTVAWACTSTPGSYDPSGSPSRPSPLSPVLTPRTAPSATSSRCASVSGSTIAPSSSASSAMCRPSCDSENTRLPLLWNGGGVGIRTSNDLLIR